MTNKITGWLATVALAFLLIAGGQALAAHGNSVGRAQGATASHVQPVAHGQQVKIIGIVIKRDADSFIFRDQTGVEREVALTPQTAVKTHKKGVFRGGKEYGVSYILRGLRLEVSGAGNARGQIVA